MTASVSRIVPAIGALVGGRGSSLVGARLAIPDVSHFLLSTPESPSDWGAYWVFGNGADGPPAVGEVVAALRSREPYVEALARRAVAVPGNVGNPYWVADHTPMSERLQVSDTPIGWPDLLDTIVQSFVPGLDIRESSWRLTVYTDVRGAPIDADGSASVVFVQVSHAVIFATYIDGLSRALFAAVPESLRIEGLGDPLPEPRPISAALLGLARQPFEYARWQVRRYRAGNTPLPATERAAALPNPRPVSVASIEAAGRQMVRVLRPDLSGARGRGVTVTALGMTAISLAFERYLGEIGQPCPPDLAALVWVAIDDCPREPGVNRVASVEGELCSTVPDPVGRARAVNAALASARNTGRLDLHYQVAVAVPFTVWRRGVRRVIGYGGGQQCDIAVSSVRLVGSSADWALANRPYVFGCHLGRVHHPAISHTFAGGEDTFTVTVSALPATVDIDRYARLLDSAFDELTAALADATVDAAASGSARASD